MPKTRSKNVLVLLLLVASFAAPARAQTKHGSASAREPCPDKRAYTGRYRNIVYGFSMRIPPGRKGFWNSAACAPDEKYGCVCMGDHGRFIPLSEETHIEAFVGYEREPEWAVIDYEKDEIAALKNQKETEKVSVADSRWVRLGGLKARRFKVRFVEKGKSVVIDHIIALFEGVEYQLILRTSVETYERDRREFEKVVASWRLRPRTR